VNEKYFAIMSKDQLNPRSFVAAGILFAYVLQVRALKESPGASLRANFSADYNDDLGRVSICNIRERCCNGAVPFFDYCLILRE